MFREKVYVKSGGWGLKAEAGCRGLGAGDLKKGHSILSAPCIYIEKTKPVLLGVFVTSRLFLFSQRLCVK
jgi:hypothetical protein